MSSAPDESKVAARMRWIERRREEIGALAPIAGDAHLGSGPENRHGQPQVPAGQHVVKKWPVLDLGDHPKIRREDWRLEVTGDCARPLELDFQGLLAYPQVSEQSDFHCVTTWSLLDSEWGGVRLADLIAEAQPHPEAHFVLITGYDQEPRSGLPYTTNLRLEDALAPDNLIVHTWNGEALPREHGGPVRMIAPRLYGWKGTKWIRKIEFLNKEQLGFWELRGYSNGARPWANDRFSG
jgi:DMSO/TMAO reductase YedYZ molybdopterin-dependent catalytic subunit